MFGIRVIQHEMEAMTSAQSDMLHLEQQVPEALSLLPCSCVYRA